MKKLLRAGWLVMAAALMAGLAACSSEESVAEEPTPQQPANPAVTADGKVHVTVGAGISDGQTRTAVEKDGTTRTLKFTTGDKLYILGSIESDDDVVRKMGGLIEVKSVSDDGLSATFDGDLTVWKKTGQWDWSKDTDWADTQTGDPMTWYGTNGVDGWLVHADAVSGLYSTTTEKTYSFIYEYSLATGATDNDNVSKLMKSALYVKGEYNKTDKCFNLKCGDAILNCTFTGLANGTYNVRFEMAGSEDEYMNGHYWGERTYYQAVTVNDGTARFALSIELSKLTDEYSGIHLWTDDDELGEIVFDCPLGQRERVYAKVYNISRHWNGSAFQ